MIIDDFKKFPISGKISLNYKKDNQLINNKTYANEIIDGYTILGNLLSQNSNYNITHINFISTNILIFSKSIDTIDWIDENKASKFVATIGADDLDNNTIDTIELVSTDANLIFSRKTHLSILLTVEQLEVIWSITF